MKLFYAGLFSIVLLFSNSCDSGSVTVDSNGNIHVTTWNSPYWEEEVIYHHVDSDVYQYRLPRYEHVVFYEYQTVSNHRFERVIIEREAPRHEIIEVFERLPYGERIEIHQEVYEEIILIHPEYEHRFVVSYF